MSHNGRHVPARAPDPRRRRAVSLVVGAMLLVAVGAGILVAQTLGDDPTVAPASSATTSATSTDAP